jgi:hypothetical protein
MSYLTSIVFNVIIYMFYLPKYNTNVNYKINLFVKLDIYESYLNFIQFHIYIYHVQM